MKVLLAKPSFWPEPRDPGAWQRALRRIHELAPVPDPRPCWEKHLTGLFSRRSIPGLYGARQSPNSAIFIGTGLLRHTQEGWVVDEPGLSLLDLEHDAFPEALARMLVRRSPWVRLALLQLHTSSWRFPRGLAPLFNRASLLIGRDLDVGGDVLGPLPDPSILFGDQMRPGITSVVTETRTSNLSPLQAPLYVLRVLGWLDEDGRPSLPDDLAASLRIETPAAILRRLSQDMADGAGFIPVAHVARRLWEELQGRRMVGNSATWQDRVIGAGIESGAIEVHAWAPGQPRHGRGLFGDRERKLVRWTIHDNLAVPPKTESKGRITEDAR